MFLTSLQLSTAAIKHPETLENLPGVLKNEAEDFRGTAYISTTKILTLQLFAIKPNQRISPNCQL